MAATLEQVAADQIAINTALANITKSLNDPVRGGKDRIFITAKDTADEEGKFGFKSFPHFLKEVYTASMNKHAGGSEFLAKQYSSEKIQTKALEWGLVTKAATGMGELVGSDGGFLAPPTFANALYERIYVENDLLARTDKYTVGGNSMVFPRNAETSRATGSRWGGVKAYWLQEGSSLTLSRPTFGRLTLNLHKLACLAAITEELIQDSNLAMAQYVNKVFANEISFMVGDALINGDGAGQPLGILNAPCTVSVTRTTTGSIVLKDINSMYARLFRGMGPITEDAGAAWFINQDCIPDLFSLSLGIGTAGVAVFIPPGGYSGKPYATLLGMPVIPVEWCATKGTVGDIILADMRGMVSISKGGLEAMSSLHFYFDTDQQAFRVTFRMDARPWWATALTPYKGTNTQSTFITLAT